jgi:cellulase
MHQQNGDRSCSSEAIGGAHYGPVMVYMSKVADSSTADGSSGWFKSMFTSSIRVLVDFVTDVNVVYENTWAAANKGSGDNDMWGTKDLNTCCGKLDVKIPASLAAGDYLLRAEVIALHTASSSGGAQFYMSCYQLTVTGGGSLSPATVQFPGAYKASDPGILINIHATMSKYVAPGPAVISEGTTVTPGNPVCPKAAKMIRGMNDVFDY